MRPIVGPVTRGGEDAAVEAERFKRVCPGARVEARREPGQRHHRVFGQYVAAWKARASDPAVRYEGSSAGVLTALSTWFLETGIVSTARAARSDTLTPTRTVPVTIMSREQALAAAGSRYAPVAMLDGYRPEQNSLFVGKPCEAAALQQFHDAEGTAADDRPPILSFFCAGTPSQDSTDGLLDKLGMTPNVVQELRYRGRGWPGDFSATDANGVTVRSPYAEAWGKHLGRGLPWRCKLCPDGTGGVADVSVGDFWEADEKGFPVFSEQEGTSVLIARTERGRRWVLAAVADGFLEISPVDLDDVARIQPLQVERKRTLLVRLLARLAAGRPVPSYAGFKLLRSLTWNPKLVAKAFLGTVERTVRKSNFRTPE